MSKNLDKIRRIAKRQGGVFANYQVDVSNQDLHYHQKVGNLERLKRTIYRVADYPRSDDEEYIVAYLWTKQDGALSHQTALSVHELSDVLPNRIHLTVPTSWKGRNIKIPDEYRLHYADLGRDDTEWYDAVPITTPLRTIEDVALAGLNPDLVEQAIDQAKARGLVSEDVEREVLRSVILRNADAE